MDDVQRFRVKDLGGIGVRTRTWLGDYFAEEALCARLAELGTDPAKLEEVPSGYRPCPVHRHQGSRGTTECLPWTVRRGQAYVLLGKRSRAVQDPGTWSCFGGAMAEGESPANAAERECGLGPMARSRCQLDHGPAALFRAVATLMMTRRPGAEILPARFT